MATRVNPDGHDLSGCLFIERGQLWYERAGAIAWSLPVDAVRVVGEAFDPSAEEGNEQILVFLADATDWEEAPASAQNAGTVLAKLGSMLGFQPSSRISSATEFTSAAMYPAGLAGRPVLEFSPLRRRNPILRLWDLLFPKTHCDVSDIVRTHLTEPRAEPAPQHQTSE